MGPFSDGWTESDVEAVLAKGDPEELLYVPIIVGMNAPDCEQSWVEDICFALADHPHFNVRGNAVLAFGHIARTCGELDLQRVLPILTKALNDSHEYVRGHANAASCDIETYLGVEVPGYDGEFTKALNQTIEKVRRQIDGDT